MVFALEMYSLVNTHSGCKGMICKLLKGKDCFSIYFNRLWVKTEICHSSSIFTGCHPGFISGGVLTSKCRRQLKKERSRETPDIFPMISHPQRGVNPQWAKGVSQQQEILSSSTAA